MVLCELVCCGLFSLSWRSSQIKQLFYLNCTKLIRIITMWAHSAERWLWALILLFVLVLAKVKLLQSRLSRLAKSCPVVFVNSYMRFQCSGVKLVIHGLWSISSSQQCLMQLPTSKQALMLLMQCNHAVNTREEDVVTQSIIKTPAIPTYNNSSAVYCLLSGNNSCVRNTHTHTKLLSY